MANKEPAFLWYSNDYYTGTRLMLPEERACYVDLLCYQHQYEYIPDDIDSMMRWCTGISKATLEATLEAKFKLCDKGWYNERLKEIMDKRENYTETQSMNGTIGQFWKKVKAKYPVDKYTEIKEVINKKIGKKQLYNIITTHKATLEATLEASFKHIENENENNIIIDTTVKKKKEKSNKKEKRKNEPADELVIFGTPKKGLKLTGKKAELFNTFWQKFNSTNSITGWHSGGKRDAIDAFHNIVKNLENGDLLSMAVKINFAASMEAKNRIKILERGGVPKMAQGWLNSGRYEDYDPGDKSEKITMSCIADGSTKTTDIENAKRLFKIGWHPVNESDLKKLEETKAMSDA